MDHSQSAERPPVGVPGLNLPAVFASIRDDLVPEMLAVCESGQYILGPKVEAFERAMSRYTGAPHALGVSSGTDALLLAMMAIGVGPGDEVIVPAFTFFATAGCVSRLGGTPVFVDVDPATFNIDVSQIEARVTPRTKAVIPVHLYGLMADMPAVMEIGRKRGITIIEDAAQAIGARQTPRPQIAGAVGSPMAGAIGEFGCLSFYPTKNLGAFGDAGMLLTQDDALFERARLLRTHGENPRYHHRMIGGNFRLDALQAVILNAKLRHVDGWNEQRRARAARYRQLFEERRIAPELVRLPADAPGHVYHQFVIRASRRDELHAYLQEHRIGAGIYYPVPLHLQDCFASLGYRKGDLPHAEAAAAEVLALPMYPELTDGQQSAVVSSIASFYRV